ncbi:hypothetical protein BD410DRAFT_100207 [Rickenella mellea]|uniref:DUF6533 domain-containing protein n=1 Tax=Rickenella mellea TaxID=50990 RepID=A0A4Y7PKQ5_9AGAM|nr:hypothetical protein BD410DRAFT_100207 [Rickenella mellea]
MNDTSLNARGVPFAFDSIHQILNLQYLSLASITILYYDHIMTLPTEIERIWRPKLSPVSVIFLLNRYIACIGYVPIIFFFFNSPLDSKPYVRLWACTRQSNELTSCSRCLLFSRYPGVLSCISQILIGGSLSSLCSSYS